MEKLPVSVGILSWHSTQVLVDTLTTYYENGLFDIVNDITILFQEFNEQDYQIAKHFGLSLIGCASNIGIGRGFIKLTENAETPHVLVLEHDWNLIESREVVYKRLKEGIELLADGYDAIRYRHRTRPGHPHYSFRHKGNELTYFDQEIGCISPHLLDSLHWLDPAENFPDKISKLGDYFITTSRWANWTNNPTLYRKDYYLQTVKPFAGEGTTLEGNIGNWWANQTFKVAQGEGLFMHNDWQKYGKV
jgi:hypothetical protein